MDNVRNRKTIKKEIDINNEIGVHTYTMCLECGKHGHRIRTRACVKCLEKELKQLDA